MEKEKVPWRRIKQKQVLDAKANEFRKRIVNHFKCLGEIGIITFCSELLCFVVLCYPDSLFNLSSSSALCKCALSGRTMDNLASCILPPPIGDQEIIYCVRDSNTFQPNL